MLSRQSLAFILCCGVFIVTHTEAQTITDLIASFSDQLDSLMCDGMRVGGNKCDNGLYGIQDFVDSFEDHFENDAQEDASDLAQSIIDRLDKKLYQRASFLRNLSAVIRGGCQTHGYDDESDESLMDFDDLFFAGNTDRSAYLPNLEYNEVYNKNVSLSSSTMKIPNGVNDDNEDIQKDGIISQLMDDTMVDLHSQYCVDSDGNEDYCMMYFGSVNGVFRQFPGVENTKTNGAYKNYDPRFRPWYVSAATGSKDVVILLDVSGSMRESNRITLAQEAIVSVLNTLGSSSFVNVVAFSSTITLSCFEEELVPATTRNIAKLIDFVSALSPNGGTDFEIAFTKAFDILESGTNCQTSIIFLTDGMAPDPSEIIASRNTHDINAVVFSYTLGSGASTAVPEQIADMTNGIYTHIGDSDENLISIMSSYYLYYAYGNNERMVLTSPYASFTTGVIMITMAMPVYINATYFVGVVATDIPLSLLSDAIGDITIGRKSYSFVMNQESELLLHPLLPDVFSSSEWQAVFVDDVEPEAFQDSLLDDMLEREEGMQRISASVKLPAGDVIYNGYIHEEAELLYIYAGVGPASLSIAIVIYTEDTISAPNVASFGLTSSPSDDCDEIDYVSNSSDLSECVAPFNMFHRLDLLKACDVDWLDTAQILNGNDSANADKHYNAFWEGKLYSVQYPTFFLQSGLFEEQANALSVDPSCDSLAELHTLTNQEGTYDASDLPYGGFRREISQNILHSIFTLSSLHEFWKPSFLAEDSLFVSMWFGHYQGLHISYPGKKFSSSYNNQIRPWYQRAVSYPHLNTWTTPYKDANTEKLVTGASTVVTSPDSEYAFGVLGFNYKYEAFVDYWSTSMSSLCDTSQDQYCFLVDSSAFCLYYDGMEDDVDDEDIGRKFIGDLEPTLMQSLLDRGFFINETNVNFQQDSIDITYIQDTSVDYAVFASQATGFTLNDGSYTVHKVSKTNLFVVYIEGYNKIDLYPSNCPSNSKCSDVHTPGCITESDECVSAAISVCVEPDTIFTSDSGGTCSEISEIGIEVLQNDEQTNICASNFLYDDSSKQYVFHVVIACIIVMNIFAL